jgi:hypothetical protein
MSCLNINTYTILLSLKTIFDINSDIIFLVTLNRNEDISQIYQFIINYINIRVLEFNVKIYKSLVKVELISILYIQ